MVRLAILLGNRREREREMSGQSPIQTVSGEVALSEAAKFECELCLEAYNLYDKKPFSLVPCGHSICIKCFESLAKTACPYCRAAFTAKIPNWEIIKRLPKPTVPIVYYHIEIKLNSLRKTAAEYDKHVAQFHSDLKSQVAQLGASDIDENSSNSSSAAAPAVTSQTVTVTEDHRPRVLFLERLAFLDKKLNTCNEENLEIGVNLRKKVDKFRSDLNQDENKYHEENLRRIKGEIETVNKTIREKIASLKRESERCQAIVSSSVTGAATSSSSSRSRSEADLLEVLKRIEAVLDQEEEEVGSAAVEGDNVSYARPNMQYLKSLLSTNVVRPMSGSSDSNEMNRPTGYNAESLTCTTSQKGSLLQIFHNFKSTFYISFVHFIAVTITIITIITVVFMLYPIAMVIVGKQNQIMRFLCALI